MRDLNNALDILLYTEVKPIRSVIKDLKKRGEIRGVARGVYEYVPKEKKRTKLDVIWHLVRSNRQFSTDEMERLSGAARDTVLEYLRCLRKLGYIKKMRGGYWRMIQDPGPETPVNTWKCRRLRTLRRQGYGGQGKGEAGKGRKGEGNHESAKGRKHERKGPSEMRLRRSR